jgi:beta-xylosidase
MAAWWPPSGFQYAITRTVTPCRWPGGSGCDSDLFQDTDGKIYDIFPLGNMYVQQVDLSHMNQHKITFVGPRVLAVPSSNRDIGLPVSPAYVEGPWTTKIGNEFYLFYAEPYFKKNPKYPKLYGYWTGCAYAKHIMGPWKKDPRGAVFWGGHLSLFNGPNGRPWFGYREEAYRRYWGLLGVDPLIIGRNGRVHAHPTLGTRYVPLPIKH